MLKLKAHFGFHDVFLNCTVDSTNVHVHWNPPLQLGYHHCIHVSWTVRENLNTQHISSHLVFSLGKYLSVMLVNCLCSCLTSLTCWFLWASECKKYNISGTLFTKHPLITVANNNLLFKKIYIYFIVVVLNRLKYLVKTTWHCNSIKEPCNYFIQQFMQMPSFRVHSSETMFPPKVTLSQAYK